MQIPAPFLAELRSCVPMRELVGRRVYLKRSGRVWKGLCCFHDEKTPSLAVYDDHATCFGCGWRGDAIQFVQDTERVEFREAVERLAASVGMEVPTDPAEVARGTRLEPLYQILDDHAELWHARLLGSAGAAALAYLRGRGLTDDTLRRWRVGWADGSVMSAPVERLKDAGLLSVTESGVPAGPFFRYRIMFPVQDQRGRVVGFSGRALGDDLRKYVNSADNELFHKGSLLYGFPQARTMDSADKRLLIVEGQLDVIAAQEVGIPAVAPLGTALTIEQLQAAWRVCSCPTLCFDGDAGGQRATERAIMTALPHITPERTLSVATMPLGRDPDTLIRTDGADAMCDVVRGARRLVDALYEHLGEPRKGDAPEARAAFRARLDEAAAKILDRRVSGEYRSALRDRYWARSKRQVANGVSAVVMPLLVETPRLRYLRGTEMDIEQAKAEFDQEPTPERLTRLIALQCARNDIVGTDFPTQEEGGAELG